VRCRLFISSLNLRVLVCLKLIRLLRSILFPYTTLFRSHAAPTRRGKFLEREICYSGPSIHKDRKKEDHYGLCIVRHASDQRRIRSEEHTSELQSRENLVCRLLLEKKNTANIN